MKLFCEYNSRWYEEQIVRYEVEPKPEEVNIEAIRKAIFQEPVPQRNGSWEESA